MIKKALFTVALFTGAFAVITAVNPLKAGEKEDGKNLVLNLKGTAVGVTRPIPPIDGTQTSSATCFDVQLIDPESGRVIGKGTDCLADIVPHGNGLALTATTYFQLPGGTIVTRGRTTVQPVLEGSPSMTHITGGIPSDNNILFGTGRYKGITGRARLSGAVNLSQLMSSNEITFDCLFVIEPDQRIK